VDTIFNRVSGTALTAVPPSSSCNVPREHSGCYGNIFLGFFKLYIFSLFPERMQEDSASPQPAKTGGTTGTEREGSQCKNHARDFT